MDTGVIYALFDPTTHLCCYVGQTSRALHERIIEHFNIPDTSPRWAWIADLKSRGLRPEIKILERTTIDDLDDAELFWIRVMSRMGMPLTNTAHLEDLGKDVSRYVILRGDEESILVIIEAKASQKRYVRSVLPQRCRETPFMKPMAKPLQYTHLTQSWPKDEKCPVCCDLRCDSINDAVAQGRPPNLIAAQYRLPRTAVTTHIQQHCGRDSQIQGCDNHLPDKGLLEYPPSLMDASIEPEPASEQPIDVLNVGLPYVRKSFRLAGTDEEEQQRLLQILNDAIASERMGL